MKSIIVALTMVAASAFASNTTVNFPKYDGVSVNNLCDAGSTFQTISPIQVCDKWVEVPGVTAGEFYQPSEWTCVAAHSEHVSVAKTGTDCLKYGNTDIDAATCLQYGTVARPNTVIAENVTTYGELQDVQYFYYTIASCGAAPLAPKPLNPKPVK